jgi:thioredoxin reductase (NADPH)
VAVVGGGNSAGQPTLFLAQHAARVQLVVREDDLGRNMSRYLVDRIQRLPNVEVLLQTEVRELLGDESLEAIVVGDNRTGERRILDARAMFVFIGVQPHARWLGDQLALDEQGFILTGADAAGDVRSGSIKRVAAAVGEGSMAVRLVHQYLEQAGVPRR